MNLQFRNRVAYEAKNKKIMHIVKKHWEKIRYMYTSTTNLNCRIRVYVVQYTVFRRSWMARSGVLYVKFGTSVCRIWYSVNCDYVVPYNVVLDTVGVSAYLYLEKFTNQCRCIFFGVKYKYLPFLDAFVFLNIKTNLLFPKVLCRLFYAMRQIGPLWGGGS